VLKGGVLALIVKEARTWVVSCVKKGDWKGTVLSSVHDGLHRGNRDVLGKC